MLSEQRKGIRLVLLRHGEPEGGALYRGRRDDPLSILGWEQMRAAVSDFPQWQGIVTSPLSRCAAFAEMLARQQGIPVHHEPRLQELDFGAWEGRTAEAILDEDGARLRAFWNDPVRHSPPQGESMDAFAARISTAFADWHERMGEGSWLWVIHGGVIRVLLAQFLGMPLTHMLRIEVPYACHSTLILGDGSPRLLAHGMISP